MLPQDRPPPIASTWQSVLRNAVRSLDELAALLDLPADSLAAGAPAGREFPLLVPRGFVARMRRGDASDPLLRQVLPDIRETLETAGYGDDPLAERASASAGVMRKYRSRALVVATAACPVHCRYCFRRAFPYADHNAAAGDWHDTLDRLAADPAITEVILSGGDPLSLSDDRLERLMDRLGAIAHVETVRLHTRFPIMIPERVTRRLISMLEARPFSTVVVVHTNHAQEIDAGVAHALMALTSCTTTVLNQSVLLRGINDDTATLEALCRRLWQCGVLPYYVHMLDRVTGTAHFDVGEDVAAGLIEALRARLPGYLVPKLVREIPGRLSKTPVS